MSIETQIKRLKTNVQDCASTLAEYGVSVEAKSDAINAGIQQLRETVSAYTMDLTGEVHSNLVEMHSYIAPDKFDSTLFPNQTTELLRGAYGRHGASNPIKNSIAYLDPYYSWSITGGLKWIGEGAGIASPFRGSYIVTGDFSAINNGYAGGMCLTKNFWEYNEESEFINPAKAYFFNRLGFKIDAWIGVYAINATDYANSSLYRWAYLKTKSHTPPTDQELVPDATSLILTESLLYDTDHGTYEPLAAGDYKIVLFANGGYDNEICSVAFTVG